MTFITNKDFNITYLPLFLLSRNVKIPDKGEEVSLLSFADRETKYCLLLYSKSQKTAIISQVILPCLMPWPLEHAASKKFSAQIGFPLLLITFN